MQKVPQTQLPHSTVQQGACGKNNMQRMRIKLGWPLDSEEIPFLKKVYKPLNKNKKTFQAMVEKHDMYERKANAAAIAFHNVFMDKIEKFIEK